jgi:hypothetical protein
MRVEDANKLLLDPALSLLPAKMDTAAARVMLLAIGLQESGFAHRRQVAGPARGYWQFEIAGVRGVLKHAQSQAPAQDALKRLDYPADPQGVYAGLQYSGLTAALMARLYLWTDPQPLPSRADPTGAWELYTRVWRPGKPRKTSWPDCHVAAVQCITGDNP